jgi:hypothetical protein
MGEEMSYRYQETLIAALLRALRIYKERLHETSRRSNESVEPSSASSS